MEGELFVSSIDYQKAHPATPDTQAEAMTNTLTPDDTAVGKPKALPLADRLEAHVRALAEDIGERNIYRLGTLSDAADYIEQQWRAMGYEVIPQTYELEGVRSSNLEITRSGTRHKDDILLIGAHYDSVIGSLGANDNATGVAALKVIPAAGHNSLSQSPEYLRLLKGALCKG